MDITWDQFEQDVDNLAKQLEGLSFPGIIAIAKGGILPAAALAYRLDIRNIQTVTLSVQDNWICLPKMLFTDYSRWLVVDEIVDSGATINLLKQCYKDNLIATVYAKSETKHLVNFYSAEVPDEWIKMPWEHENDKM